MSTTIKPITGTSQDDVLQGGNAHEVLSGRAGDDTIKAGNGQDEGWGGSGDDLILGQKGNDVLYGGGGPCYINLAAVTIAEDYQGQVIFENESAGYRNSLGSYKVDANGNIYDVQFHFTNASLQGSGGDLVGGVSSSALDLNAGDQIGFFIVANGYSYNGAYNGMDFNTGTLEFRNADGSQASLQSSNPSLWYVSANGDVQQLIYHTYHTAAGLQNDDYSLNPDSIAHTVGLLHPDSGLLTLGFEDLYNGGDRDFDDSVFTIDIGQSNAQVLDPNAPAASGGDDGAQGNAGSGNDQVDVSENDELHGGTGNDHVYGRAGNDLLYGDNGTDSIYGGSGVDTAYGGEGSDAVYGGAGNDLLYGDTGNDTVGGGSGDDVIDGGSGNDVLEGGSGADQLSGQSGNDQLDGGSGDDSLDGGSGTDILEGNSGNDTLNGGSGNDTLNGGSGDDVIVSGTGSDSVNGGSGIDTISYADTSSAVKIDLHNKKVTGGDSDTILSIENAIGSAFDDTFRGDKRDNTLNAGDGNDVLRGGTGADTLTGGDGADTFFWHRKDMDDNLDSILDFVLAEDTLQFDVNTALANLEVDQWLNFTTDGTNTSLAADFDADGDFSNATTFVELDNISISSLNDIQISVA